MRQHSLNLNTLTTVLNEVGAHIYTKDLQGRYTYANGLVLELFGVEIDELIGKNDYYFFNPHEIDDLIENDRKVLAGEVIETEESLIVKRTSEKKYYIVVKKPLFDKDGNIIGMFGISTDITKQKLLENRILNQKTFLDTILDNVDAYIYMKDENRVFRYVNSKVAALFGLPVYEIVGKVDSDVIPEEIADSFWESDLKVLKTQQKISNEEYFENEKGISYYWSIKIPYYLDGASAILGFSSDITQLKYQENELEEKDKILFQQTKISMMGEMIENIAHQWRQPLSVIATAASGSRLKKEMKLLDDDEFFYNMDSINMQAQYLSNTIDDFRNFFLSDSLLSFNIDIKETIEKALSLVKDSFRNSNIELILNLESGLIYNCKENLFIQAIINILNNARDVLAQLDSEAEKYVFIDLVKENGFCIIKIKDNGGGIPRKFIDKIFEPYFTTKHKSQGTGIGLYMTYQIISKFTKSSIVVQNVKYVYKEKKYKGASFNITIPLD